MSKTDNSAPDKQRSGHGPGELRPAFATTRQAFWFLALVVSVLLLPEIISWSGLLSRRHSYELMAENHGGYAFVAQEVFDEPKDIDVLFLGSSIMFSGIDTPKVQQALSDDIGRPARAVTFGHYFNSVDVLYVQLRDVLERKRVGMVVLSIPRVPFTVGPSTTGCRFVKYSDVKEIFYDLPFKYQASMYSCGLLRTPRELLTIVRKNQIPESSFASGLGMDKAEIGQGRDPLAFARFLPEAPRFPAEAMIWSRETKDRFQFINDKVPFYQNVFLEKLAELCRQKGVPLVMLNIPQHVERQSDTIIERENWRERFGEDVPMIGIPPSLLFAGLADEEQEKLRFDDGHFNANGREFFTKAVMPAILEVYRTNARKDH